MLKIATAILMQNIAFTSIAQDAFAMNEIEARLRREPVFFTSTDWIGQVHDSVLFDTAPHAAKKLCKIGIDVFEDLPAIISDLWQVDFNLPMTGEATAGINYGLQTASVKHENGEWIAKGNWGELCP